MKSSLGRIYPDYFLVGFEPKKNTQADLSQIHFAEYAGIGGCYSDLDYYPALGRAAEMAFLEYHRFLGPQRRTDVSLCLAGL